MIAWILGPKATVPVLTVGMFLGNGARVWSSRLLGGFLLGAVPGRHLLAAPGLRVRLAHFPLIGGVFGFLGSLVGGVGPVLSPFFLGHGLVRGAYIATDALCTVGTYSTRALVFHRYHLLTEPTVVVGLYIGALMIAGAWIGRRLLDRMSERTFLRVIDSLLVLFGPQLLLWPVR